MKLLALCGRKQSGKDSLGNFLLRNRKEFFGIERAKKCGWAYELKNDLHKKFDIPIDLLYGSDDDKNTLTKVRWGDLPHWCELLYQNRVPDNKGQFDCLTIRELLQQWGTEVCRRMSSNIWVNSTMKQIEIDKFDFCVVTDTRFPNEVEAIKNKGGKVVRLTRNGKVPATHDSELALDKGRYDWNKFDGIVDNENCNLDGQERIMINLLEQWGWKI